MENRARGEIPEAPSCTVFVSNDCPNFVCTIKVDRRRRVVDNWCTYVVEISLRSQKTIISSSAPYTVVRRRCTWVFGRKLTKHSREYKMFNTFNGLMNIQDSHFGRFVVQSPRWHSLRLYGLPSRSPESFRSIYEKEKNRPDIFVLTSVNRHLDVDLKSL